VINDDPPAPGRSADDDAELDAEDALLGVIGVDELGGVILGAPRRRSPAHEAYWREQAVELERALEATGDKNTRVFVGAGGRLHLYDPAEEGVSDSPSSDVFANAIETAPAPPTSDATSERPSAEDSRTAPKTSGASSEEEASSRSGADDASLSASRFFASVATLGLPALANSCVEPLLSSAETACAAKMGVLYLAALAPSTSLFAFAAEMCFAVSVVVTTAVAKAGAVAAAGKRSAFAAAETSSSSASASAAARVAVASMSAAFGGGALLAAVFAIAAAPILSLMHVPPEAHATVRTYVAIRALGLPFFAAANAAEGAFVGDGDGATPMRAWVAGGAASLAALVLASHPSALGLGLPGAACAIAGGQALTLLLFWREMRRKGWFDQRGAGSPSPSEGETKATKKTRGAAAASSSSSSSSSSSLAGHARDLARVLSDSNVVRDIGWMFLGAVSRMGTYAAVTTAASALGVIPGATHKVALETFWLLSFFTEPVFTASNALLPREMGCKGGSGGGGSGGGREGIGGARDEEERDGFGASEGIGRHSSPSPRARKLRDAFVACSVALGAALALAASRMTATAAYSDDPAVSALLATLSTPVALTVGLSAIAYGVEGTLIGAGRVGYLGRTHARDFFVVLAALKARELGGAGGAFAGLAGVWWILAAFQGLRIAQHWVHLRRERPFERRGRGGGSEGERRSTLALA
jgi:Na+-driven multidrug efflux pump